MVLFRPAGGNDFAGVVDAVGPGVEHLHVGDPWASRRSATGVEELAPLLCERTSSSAALGLMPCSKSSRLKASSRRSGSSNASRHCESGR